jgi:hypothetical protein
MWNNRACHQEIMHLQRMANWRQRARFVRTTRGNMPPYTEKVLSDPDLADIYAFLRSIPPAPDFKTIAVLNGLLTSASTQR